MEAKDFVKKLLNKDLRRRMIPAQALAHPWLRNENQRLPLDLLTYKLVISYIRAIPLQRAALKALSKALNENELFYLKAQFKLLEPKDNYVLLESSKMALLRNVTDAMKQARVPEILDTMEPLSTKKMNIEEFCSAGIDVHQLEALDNWATTAFQYFEQEGNRLILVEELARVSLKFFISMFSYSPHHIHGVPNDHPLIDSIYKMQAMNADPKARPSVKDWVNSSDGHLNLLGYTNFLHGVIIQSSNTGRQ